MAEDKIRIVEGLAPESRRHSGSDTVEKTGAKFSIHPRSSCQPEEGLGIFLSAYHAASPSAERSFLDALESFEEAIQRTNWPSALVDQLMGEIDAIYAELSKPHPSLTVLQEKGRSMRNTLEQVTARIEAPNVIAAAQALWSAIGLAETS